MEEHYTIQVQHSSDHELDGAWFDLDHASDASSANRKFRYLMGWRVQTKGKNAGKPYMSNMGYNGRPMRILCSLTKAKV